MRIISKYKDFYDHLATQIVGVDENDPLTYVRDVNVITQEDDEFMKKIRNVFRTHHLRPNYFSYGAYRSILSHISWQHKDEIVIAHFLFGIYPYVYTQPIAIAKYVDPKTDVNEKFIYVISQKDIDENELTKKIISSIEKITHKNYKIGYKTGSINNYSAFGIKNYSAALKANTFKIEYPEIFKKFGSPVFVKYDVELFENGIYERNLNNKTGVHYITNISFQKLNYNILKYWWEDLNNINTYINIENFLWSIKQEPESIPDNKTKIINHGFDLKTSFRNM